MSDLIEVIVQTDTTAYNNEKLSITLDERDRLWTSFDKLTPPPVKIETPEKVVYFFTGIYPFKKLVFEVPKPARTDINPTIPYTVKQPEVLTPHIGMTAPSSAKGTSTVVEDKAKYWDSSTGKEVDLSSLEEKYRKEKKEPDMVKLLARIQWAMKQIQKDLDVDNYEKAQTTIDIIEDEVMDYWVAAPDANEAAAQLLIDFEVQKIETLIGLQKVNEASTAMSTLISSWPNKVGQFSMVMESLNEAKRIVFGDMS